jgi:hypothetical protein
MVYHVSKRLSPELFEMNSIYIILLLTYRRVHAGEKEMKKIFLMGVMLIALAIGAFAQNKDNETVWQGDGTPITGELIYHLEIYDNPSSTDTLAQVNAKLLDFRKYGAVGYLVHGTDGYIVALYANSEWKPGLEMPSGVTRIYGIATATKNSIREALDGGIFREKVKRASFIADLNIVYGGL